MADNTETEKFPSNRPITDQEAFWDEHIAPQVRALQATCAERNIPFFLIAQLTPGNGDGETLAYGAFIPVQACQKLKILATIAAAENMSEIVFGVVDRTPQDRDDNKK